MAAVDCFWPCGRIILLRGRGRCEPRQRLAVIPGHPLRWVGRQLPGMPLQLGEVVEGIGSIQLAGVDQAHEQVTGLGAVQRFVEERILAVQNRFLQGTLDDIMPIPGLCRVAGIWRVPHCLRMMADAA